MNNNFPDKVEPYLVLLTTADQDLANRICSVLEEVSIPVIIEHVDVMDENYIVAGYKLLAPPRFRETATRLVDIHLSIHETRSLVTLRSPEYTH